MRKRSLIIIFLYFFIFLPSTANAEADNYATVSVVGSSPLLESELDTKNDALADGFRKALEKVVETMLPQDKISRDAGFIEWRIYSRARSYVINYSITGKPETTQSASGELLFRLPVDVKIAILPLKKDMIETGILERKVGREFALRVTILNLSDYKEFKTLKQLLQGVDRVKGLSYVSFSRGLIVLTVRVLDSPGIFLEGIVKGLPDIYKVSVVAENSIEIKKITAGENQ